jgi:N-acetylmuramic acid 6-phosphate (MurNAc-6-P) etherase
MILTGVSAAQAEQQLNDHQGFLRSAADTKAQSPR